MNSHFDKFFVIKLITLIQKPIDKIIVIFGQKTPFNIAQTIHKNWPACIMEITRQRTMRYDVNFDTRRTK